MKIKYIQKLSKNGRLILSTHQTIYTREGVKDLSPDVELDDDHNIFELIADTEEEILCKNFKMLLKLLATAKADGDYDQAKKEMISIREKFLALI